MRAWDEGVDFGELVRADPEISARVDLDAVFDPSAYTRHVDTVFERLRALAAAREEASMAETAIHIGSGKVRELYALDEERLLLVASDRISVFDVVLPTPIPDKGRVLTGLSAFWFARTRRLVPNHLLGHPRRTAARSSAGGWRCCRVELVVRGYLAGSGWRDYAATGAVCGHRSRPGLLESDRLPAPIVTPATKAASGHDENITEEAAASLCGPERVRGSPRGRARAVPLRRCARRGARDHPRGHEVRAGRRRGRARDARRRGAHARLVALLAADGYAPGGPQPSFDKQYVRDWCEATGWDKTPPGPELPDEVVEGTRARYVEAFERLTGIPFDAVPRRSRRWCSVSRPTP